MLKLGLTISFFISIIYGNAIDLSKRYLKPTPDISNENYDQYFNDLKARLDKGKFNLSDDFYLFTKLRDCRYDKAIGLIHKKNIENEIFTVMYLNYLSQTNCGSVDLEEYLYHSNDIVKELVIQLIGDKSLLQYEKDLNEILKNSDNIYIQESIKNTLSKFKENDTFVIPYLIDSEITEPSVFRNKTLKNKLKKSFVKDYNDIVNIPVAKKFIHPHQSYGKEVRHAPGKAKYGNSHGKLKHVGVDSGWMLEGMPIHSISDGIVRRIQHESTWGTLIVIETQSALNEPYTVFYGHLSHRLEVKPGDIVYSGQVIGRIGNNISVENGGYWSHLHLGISKNYFHDAQLTGYSSSIESFQNPYELFNN